MKHLSDDLLFVRLLALPINIRLSWESLPGTNTQLLLRFINYTSKKFYDDSICRGLKKVPLKVTSIKSHSKEQPVFNGATTFSIMTLGIMTFAIITLSITTNNIECWLSPIHIAECSFAECSVAECSYHILLCIVHTFLH